MPTRLTVDSLDPNMTVAEALVEATRVRREQARARNIRGLAKFYEVHRDEVLEKQKVYREANREKINARKREARARIKNPGPRKPQDDFSTDRIKISGPQKFQDDFSSEK